MVSLKKEISTFTQIFYHSEVVFLVRLFFLLFFLVFWFLFLGLSFFKIETVYTYSHPLCDFIPLLQAVIIVISASTVTSGFK